MEFDKADHGLLDGDSTLHQKAEDGRGKKREIRMANPTAVGIEFHSFMHLKATIEKRYPGLKRHHTFTKLMKDAKFHRILFERKLKNPRISPKELRTLSRELGISRNKAEGWIHYQKLPRIYQYLSQAISREDGLVYYEKIIDSLNGAITYEDMKRKLQDFFLYSELRSLDGYEKHDTIAEQFYRFLSHIQEGGLRKDIARLSSTHRKNIGHWINSQLPRLPRIASEVPIISPSSNWTWLPTSTKGKSFLDWIKVPIRVKSFDDVRNVLFQISSVETKQMKEWSRSFGKLSKSDAFGYILGVICSDGYFQRNSMIERVALSLSKTYDWSKDFGDGFCYCLGLVGINAKQISDSCSRYEWDDTIRECHMMNWISDSSPILNWIKRSCLGYELEGSKSKIDAEWIMESPIDFQISFIQGVSDGDGTVTSMRAEISTNSEGEFYSQVLDSLGFSTIFSDSRVLIHRVEDIPEAARLPMFRFASERQRKLERLSKMAQASSDAGYMNASEKDLIRNLIKQGYGRSEIRIRIWEELGISRSEVAIWRFKRSLDDAPNPEQND